MTELRVTVPDQVAQRLASAGAERGRPAEDAAAEVLRLHVPAFPGESLPFIGMFEASPRALSVADAERRLEDGDDNEFPA